MRIINRKEFVALPPGTLFMKYCPLCFDQLCIKDDTINGGQDFCVNDVTNTILCGGSREMQDILFTKGESGESIKMDFNAAGRDGCYDEDQLFAIYEREDVLGLLGVLTTCLKEAYPDESNRDIRAIEK